MKILNRACVKCGYFVNQKDIFSCRNCPDDIDYYIEKNISIFDYNSKGKDLIMKLKNIDEFNLVIPFLETLIKSHAVYFKNKIDLVTYIPSHWLKFLYRGYNQSELLCQILAKQLNRPFKKLLNKDKIRSQSSKTLEERKTGLKGTFSAYKINQEEIKDRNILIVDDVMTTGTTLLECSRVLKEKGARKIFTFTVCRSGLKKYHNT